MRAKRTWRDVLVIGTPQNQNTVRRAYEAWREERGGPLWPLRCDNPVCQFYTGPLEWNGQALPLILDHLLGNRGDNSPGSLQFLCPNCDAQNKKTRGGANKGRIRDVIEGGYTRLERDDTRSIIRTGVSVAVGYAAAEGHATRNCIRCGNLLPTAGTLELCETCNSRHGGVD